MTLLSTINRTTGLFVVGTYMAVLGVGLGATMQNLVLSVQNNTAQSDMGAASALVAFFRTMGGAIGVSALGTALSHQVSGSVVAGLTKVGVNASAATNSQSLPDLSRLPAPVRLIFEQAFGDATGHIFLIATPFALLTLLRQVRRAAVARARLIHPELQLAGYAVLVWLAAHDGARSADVANALDMDKGAVSRRIDHLERLRLVKRVIDPHDKRAHGLTLTPAGSSRIAALRARGRADLQEISRLGRTASATTPRRRLPAGIAHQVHLRDDCTQSLCMRN